jgi:zinc protease
LELPGLFGLISAIKQQSCSILQRNMLNRKIAPAVSDTHHLELPEPRLVTLDNGIPVYVLDFPDQEIVKIEVVFRAGRPEEQKRMVSRACARLLREGTSKRAGAEIAEFIDFYGGTLSIPGNLDTSNFTLFSLKKYTRELIPLFAEILTEPSFPQTELDTFIRTGVQDLLVELGKVEILAYRKITEQIFGENHPYGYNSTAADYQALTREDLLQFYNEWYTPENCIVFASGRIDEEVIGLLNQHLGQTQRSGKKADFQSVITDTKSQKTHISMPESLQMAIKIGRRTFNKHHPDSNGLFILNTILGGYFGSRLMMNIREKRGFTYNIYSSHDTYLSDGCFYIATEVNKDKAKATIKEIYAELKNLREKPVDNQELLMVRNYLLGMMLNGLDGPLNTSDVVKSMILEQLPADAYAKTVETIRTITPAEIQELANKYLQPDDLWVVTAGT